MDLLTRLFEPPASTAAAEIAPLTIALLSLTMIFITGIFGSIAWFAWKYRKGSGADRSNPPVGNLKLELAWIIAPLILGLIIYYWAASLYFTLFMMPQDGKQVYVIGKQWMWKIYHEEGRSEIDELHVPVNKPVILTLASQDVIHNFYIPDFKIKMDAVPGKFTRLWFQAERTGEFWFLCAQYCGTQHSTMRGRLIVMSPEDYQAWISDATAGRSVVVAGEQAFKKYGCGDCHAFFDNGKAPPLRGMYRKVRQEAGGEKVVVDENYLRQAIMDPEHLTAGNYPGPMPSFRGQVSEEELIALIAWIKSLGGQ